MGFKGVAADVYGGVIVDLQKVCQTTAVVVMTVGEYRHIHAGQIDVQRLRVAQKEVALPHVKKKVSACRLDIQR